MERARAHGKAGIAYGAKAGLYAGRSRTTSFQEIPPARPRLRLFEGAQGLGLVGVAGEANLVADRG